MTELSMHQPALPKTSYLSNSGIASIENIDLSTDSHHNS
jgi:hypothetical protein